ncbi:MAG: hypothetical protein ACLTDX_03110 [[Clostridium] innocuum]
MDDTLRAWEDFKTSLQDCHAWQHRSMAFRMAWNSVIACFTETIPAWMRSYDGVSTGTNQIPYNIGLYRSDEIIGHFIQWGIDLKNFVTEDIPAFINSVVEWFKSLPGKIWEWLKSAWEKVKTWGSDTYNSAKESVTKTIDKIVEWFRSLPGKVQTWLSNTISKVKAWGSDALEYRYQCRKAARRFRGSES